MIGFLLKPSINLNFVKKMAAEYMKYYEIETPLRDWTSKVIVYYSHITITFEDSNLYPVSIRSRTVV